MSGESAACLPVTVAISLLATLDVTQHQSPGGNEMSRASTYGESYADVYDEVYRDFQPSIEEMRMLEALAAGGRALELGVGSGRVAIPLARAGVHVVGLDASPSMLERLVAGAAAAGVAERIEPVCGSAATFVDSGTFTLIYAPFNFMYLVGSESDQQQLFANAAQMLDDDGVLVTETFVPRSGRALPDGRYPAVVPPPGRSLAVKGLMDDMTILAASEFDTGSHRWRLHEIVLSDDAPPRVVRSDLYCTPADTLATLAAEAGMRVIDSYGGWDRSPADEQSMKHVTVYGKAGATS
jgi:SAM-dependent methyltransferase